MEPSKPDGPHKPDVLVVDDTPANLLLLTGMLKERGYKVRPVPSGKLAIRAVQKVKPDLILLDINMPDMNGYAVCEQIKADEETKDIPVLFISALDEPLDKIRAFAAGGVDYVTKPFQFEEVEARVQTHLKIRRLQIDLAEQNRQLQENVKQLQKLELLRDNLTHMIIHDMRSPLMGITGYLELLELNAGPKLDRGDQKILASAQNSGAVLVDMITSLLDVSRLEQGQMPIHAAGTDLNDLVQNALRSLGSLTNQVELTCPKKAMPVMVNCDENLVTRVIANLVGNAIKFTPEGGKVDVSVERDGEGAKLCVSDTGSGIPQAFHEKIFEKFAQGESRQHYAMHSTGLGLTFCKLAIEAHGGKIGVGSEVDKGSTFWFTLPGSPPQAAV